MNPILRNLMLGVTALAMAVPLASGTLSLSAFAQVSAPLAAAALPEATIKSLQEALIKQGIAVTANGVLDNETRAAIRKYQSQHHLPVTGEPDKATLDKLGVVGQSGELPGGSQVTGGTFSGQSMGGKGPGMMGMMTPEMMQMMQMMQRMMGQGGMSGMAGQGMSPGGMSPSMLYGIPHGTQEEMTSEQVRALLEQRLTQHGNPRLKIGTITTAADGSITAEIMTIDDSLVQKLAFNRYPGFVRQLR